MKKVIMVSFVTIVFIQLLIGSRPPSSIECWDLNNHDWGSDDIAYGIDNKNGITVIVGSSAVNYKCFMCNYHEWTEIKDYAYPPLHYSQQYKSVTISGQRFLAVGYYRTNQILAEFDADSGYMNSYVYHDGQLCDIENYKNNHYLVCGKNSYATGSNAFIMELNSSYDSVWSAVLTSGENSGVFYDLEVTDDGGFIVTGQNDSFSLVKFDSSYNIEWYNDVVGLSVCQNSDGGYAICRGYTYIQMFLFDSNGDTILSHIYDDTTGSARSIIYDPYSDGYLISGSTELEARDGEDLRVIKVDIEGDIEWSFIWDGTSSSSTNYRTHDICHASVLAESEEYEGPFDYLITGTIGMIQDTLDSKDVFLLRFYNYPGGDEEYLNLSGISMRGVNTLNYPIIKNILEKNTTMVFNIENPGQMDINLSIYNILGQEIINLGSYSNDYISVNWDKYDHNGIKIAPGKYFINIETMNCSFTQGFLVVE